MSQITSYNEQELVAALALGEPAAFDRIYYQYYGAVRANILKIVRDENLADDILQEVFISLWDKREKFAHYTRIGGWLFVSSFNRSMNYLRTQANDRLRIDPAGLSYDYADDSGQTGVQEEQFRLLEEAIAQLPPQRRKVFELCRFGGRTYEQAAQELSISKNTVKDHLAHANESIRDYIELHGGGSLHLACFALSFLYALPAHA